MPAVYLRQGRYALNDLNIQQELMRERMAARKTAAKKNQQFKAQLDRDARKQEKAERKAEEEEIANSIEVEDSICPYCRVNHTTRAKRTGELLPCPRCYNRRISLFKYGMTLRQFWNMFREQEGRCAICGGEMDPPHVDHCHDLGHVRGLLCGLCNTGLGSFKDSAEVLQRAATYLNNNLRSRKWHYTGRL